MPVTNISNIERVLIFIVQKLIFSFTRNVRRRFRTKTWIVLDNYDLKRTNRVSSVEKDKWFGIANKLTSIVRNTYYFKWFNSETLRHNGARMRLSKINLTFYSNNPFIFKLYLFDTLVLFKHSDWFSLTQHLNDEQGTHHIPNTYEIEF